MYESVDTHTHTHTDDSSTGIIKAHLAGSGELKTILDNRFNDYMYLVNPVSKCTVGLILCSESCNHEIRPKKNRVIIIRNLD